MKQPVVVPTVTAYDSHEYRSQIERIRSFAPRIHIDLMDGIFAPTKSPAITTIWFPKEAVCDIHLMFMHPLEAVTYLLPHKPSMIVLHAESNQDSLHKSIALIEKSTTRWGLSLLADTKVGDKKAGELIQSTRHILVFSGHLGYHGGEADLGLLEKVLEVKKINPRAEIGWDGGINRDNIATLVGAGVDVLNVGGAIQHAEKPKLAFDELSALSRSALIGT